jgi:hypothetical protein
MMRFVRTYVQPLLLCALMSVAQAAAELYDNNGNAVTAATPLTGRVPVLFVHGHGPADTLQDPHYKRNWWTDHGTLDVLDRLRLTSFRTTINQNPGLDIQPYYIRFANPSRSIVEDAREIGEAVDLIIARHNPAFATANPNIATADPPGPPPVQVVIIAFSKGTISARQYLQSLQIQVSEAGATPLPPPRPHYRPVSEFIAISPPNHGLANDPIFGDLSELSLQQLYNGVQPIGNACGQPFVPSDARALNFIEKLNGDPVLDGQVPNTPANAGEAPGSRPPDQLPHQGTLYVAFFATNNADIVGGDGPSGDCAGGGRKVAANLATNAINIAVPGIPDSLLLVSGPAVVHDSTVHFQDVVCKALYAASHHRSPAGQPCLQNDRVPAIPLPQPAAAMLALDISGSMGIPACPTCTATRLDVLKESVELFAQLWLMLGRAEDRLGVTYFNTQVDQFLVNTEAMPLLTPDNITTIMNDLGQRSPANLTAMGGALQRSIEALSTLPANTNAPRHVILFTDGMQNVNPMVHELSANPPQHDIRDEPGRPPSGVPATNLRLDMLSGITVDTIGIGTGQAFVDLLAAIAGETRGLTPTDPTGVARSTANSEDLRQFFVEALIDTLRGSSPQLIAYRRGALGNTGATEAFTANKSARKLIFKVSWPRGQKLDVRVLKGGIDITSSARAASGDFYRILAFDQPTNRDALAGAWQLRITGPPGVNYEAAAILDEPELRYRVRVAQPRSSVGSPMRFVVDIGAGKRPIDGRVNVIVTVEQPRVAVGNLLISANPANLKGSASEPGMTLAEQRLVSLFTDARWWKQLTTPRVTNVRLRADGKGAHQGVLDNVTVPGLYRATVHISGEDSRLGRFERAQSVTAIVRFGAADRRKSELALRPKEKSFELTLRPRDRHGNLLGPGLANEIRLAAPPGIVTPVPDDLGDGRYRFIISPRAPADLTMKLTVAERQLFKGRLKDLRIAGGR